MNDGGQLGFAKQHAFGARGQQNIGSRGINGSARGLDTRHSMVDRVQRVGVIAGVVFNRQTRHARFNRKRYIGRNAFGVMGEAAFEISIHWDVNGSNQFPQISQHLIACHGVVFAAHRPRKARAGAGNRFEP